VDVPMLLPPPPRLFNVYLPSVNVDYDKECTCPSKDLVISDKYAALKIKKMEAEYLTSP
jgi:hypothetical protein